jgi:hypothetical protein
MTASDIIRDALYELGVLAAGESLQAQDAEYGLGKLNRLLDNWNAERAAVYAQQFVTYTITPLLQPHTIGPTGATFTVTQRPQKIDGANIILDTSTPDVRTPLEIRGDDWWRDLPVPEVTGSVPTDLYYSPDWPNGSIYLWPEPTVAYGLELETRILLAALTLASTFSLPPGYQDAITLTLAESLVPAYPSAASILPVVEKMATRARGRVFGNNDVTPRLATVDAGMPGGGSGSSFNYKTGR